MEGEIGIRKFYTCFPVLTAESY